MKRFRMSVTASCFFTVEATSGEEAIAKARSLVRDLPFGEGEAVSVDPDYYTALPEAEVVFYLDTDSTPEIEDVEEVEMYVRYTTKETQARVECERVAHHDDGRVMVLSCHGPQQTLRGLSAVLTSDTKMRLEWYDEDDCATAIAKDGCGYRTYKHPLCQGLWQFLWVSKDSRLLVAGKEARGQALLGDPFTTPVLPDWVPHVQSALEENDLLTELSGEGCESAYLTASSEDLDQIVSDGIRSGALKISE